MNETHQYFTNAEHVHEYDDITGDPFYCPTYRCEWNADEDDPS